MSCHTTAFLYIPILLFGGYSFVVSAFSGAACIFSFFMPAMRWPNNILYISHIMAYIFSLWPLQTFSQVLFSCGSRETNKLKQPEFRPRRLFCDSCVVMRRWQFISIHSFHLHSVCLCIPGRATIQAMMGAVVVMDGGDRTSVVNKLCGVVLSGYVYYCQYMLLNGIMSLCSCHCHSWLVSRGMAGYVFVVRAHLSSMTLLNKRKRWCVGRDR